ncbi:hypothetical protein [Heyndrickxia camelliae]|uniref:Uncharacterized protein n=1 Tax=Heyndrickxia camelliae TaxID=1707093 RepID=A0A2N3LJ16_9BACI|nr:hypothetical protein [Heyndrickxia camelliae]PKR84621.1 hypothetical protein CWO92_12985 [Heyndrickxia camelliae]
MTTEKLIIWEPLEDNPFCRYDNEMYFVDVHYQKDFVLIFEDIKNFKEYRFTYKQDKAQTYAIISFRIFDELGRPDIDDLIGNAWRENEGTLTYKPTFYKVENSSWISWYDSIYPARVGLYPNAEHHLYVTSDFMLEVISENEPVITVEKQ